MLKKLQNLLFEDEEVIEEQETDDDEAVEEAPKEKHTGRKNHKKSVNSSAAEYTEEPVRQPEMKRIDVTQPLPTAAAPAAAKPAARPSGDSVFSEPVMHASPRPIQTPAAAEPAEKQKLGISVDELMGNQTQQAQPAAKPAAAAYRQSAYQQTAKAGSRKGTSTDTVAYEFRPVISPIFGVDDKDMDAVQTTSKAAMKRPEDDHNVTPILSPIYGQNQDQGPSMVQKTVAKSNAMENLNPSPVKKAAEDDVPEFSLDDILKVRDEEFAQQNLNNTAKTSLFADDDDAAGDDVDQTVVINNRNLSLFDDGPDTDAAADQKGQDSK